MPITLTHSIAFFN